MQTLSVKQKDSLGKEAELAMEAISCLLQCGPCEDRALLLWAQSALLVACLLRFWPDSGVVGQMKARLLSQGVSLQRVYLCLYSLHKP